VTQVYLAQHLSIEAARYAWFNDPDIADIDPETDERAWSETDEVNAAIENADALLNEGR